jgi:hypothetical protein
MEIQQVEICPYTRFQAFSISLNKRSRRTGLVFPQEGLRIQLQSLMSQIVNFP